MINLTINEIRFQENEYEIIWSLAEPIPFVDEKPVYIKYDFSPPREYFYPLNSFLALFIPVLLTEDNELNVKLPFHINEDLQIYWQRYVFNVFEGAKKSISFNCSDESSPEISIAKIEDLTPNEGIGILFGGGVESMFGLSKLYHKNPVLISVIGERWMNNDVDQGGIKFQIEEELVRKFSLNMQRVQTNLRDLIDRKDSFVNRYSTGPLFYFLSLPITNEFNLGFIYQVYEFEYAMNLTDYDLSISPRFVIDISIQKVSFPLYTPAFTGYSKIHMLKELAKTDFLEYIYSCLNNTDMRWCGKCGKCFRISEYCYYTGIDKKRIGMQEGIIGKRETSPLAQNFWLMLDKLYKKDRRHEWQIKWRYILKKLHIGNK